jgi:hypothetical protein
VNDDRSKLISFVENFPCTLCTVNEDLAVAKECLLVADCTIGLAGCDLN